MPGGSQSNSTGVIVSGAGRVVAANSSQKCGCGCPGGGCPCPSISLTATASGGTSGPNSDDTNLNGAYTLAPLFPATESTCHYSYVGNAAGGAPWELGLDLYYQDGGWNLDVVYTHDVPYDAYFAIWHAFNADANPLSTCGRGTYVFTAAPNTNAYGTMGNGETITIVVS